MSNKKHINLEKDAVGGLLLRLIIPAFLAQLISATYIFADRVFIGMMGDPLSIAGIGIVFPIPIFLAAIISLLSTGAAPYAAMKMGEKDNATAEKVLGNCTILLIAFGVLIPLIMIPLINPILYFFGASESTLPYASDYVVTYLAGSIFPLIAISLNGFISVQGFAKTGMIALFVSSIINIILDPIFIFGFGMGVRGAALATVIAQGLAAAWVVRFLMFSKRAQIKIKLSNLKIYGGITKKIILLGLSPFIMQITEVMLIIAFNTSLRAAGSDDYISAMTIILGIALMLALPLNAISFGGMPIISYNYGAGKIDRVWKAFKYIFISSSAFSILFWACAMLIPQYIVAPFTGDVHLQEITTYGMRLFFAGAFCMGTQFVCTITFIGVCQPKFPALMATIRKVVIIIPLIFILPKWLGIDGVFVAETVGDIAGATVNAILFFAVFGKVLRERHFYVMNRVNEQLN